MLRHQLLKDPNVLFTGYKNPHPLEHKVILRIQVRGSLLAGKLPIQDTILQKLYARFYYSKIFYLKFPYKSFRVARSSHFL